MTEQAEPISKKHVVYRIAGMDSVRVVRDVTYSSGTEAPLVMDLYYPANADAALPVLIVVLGYRDAGYERAVGCRFKDTTFAQDWARLVAASGMVGVLYTTEHPADDLAAAVGHLREHAASLGIDGDRIGVFGMSGNGPVTLAALLTPALGLQCAVFGWAFLMDVDSATHVADNTKQWRFANPTEGRSFADLATGVPMFIARAGQDQFQGLNDALDRFAAKALAANLPLSLVNYPAGPHAFDTFDDGDASREIIRQMLAFMRFHLRA